jgi:zinc protease
MIKSVFSGIPKRPPAPRVAVTPIDLKYKRIDQDLDIERTTIYVGWKLPPRTSKDWSKAQALFQLVGKLAEQADKWEFATNVRVDFIGGQLAPVFFVAVELPEGGDVDEALDYIWRATKTAHWGLKNQEFDRDTKAFLKMGFVESIEALDARANRVADEIEFGDGTILFDGKGEYLMHEFFEIDKLSADGYGEFVKKTLDKDKAMVFVFRASKKGTRGDTRASLTFSASSHDQQPEPIVDPSEAKRPLPAPNKGSILSKAERYTLSNGMRVVLLPTEGLPIVNAELHFRVGDAHEPKDKLGLAGVAADFLRPPKDANFTAFVSIGGESNADTTVFQARSLNIYTDILIKGLERFIKIGEYDQPSIERFQKRLREAYRSREFRRNKSYGHEVWSALFGKDHPYAIHDGPTPDSVDNIGYDAAMDWKKSHYTANNATLVVVGNFNVSDVKKLVSDNFGDWDGGRRDEPVSAAVVNRTGPEYIGVVGEERPQMQVGIAFPSPAGIDGQNAARLVLAEMIKERMGEIRTELGSTYGLFAGRSASIGPSAMQIGGTVDADRAGESLKAMRAKLDSLRHGDNFDKTLALARRRVLRTMLASSSETADLAARLARIEIFGLDPDYYDSLAKYIASVSPAQVKALIESELDPKNEVLVCMADRKTLEKAFKEAGLNTVKYVEPK